MCVRFLRGFCVEEAKSLVYKLLTPFVRPISFWIAMHYNFVRIRTTPTIEAGRSDYVWPVEEIVGLLG